LRLTGETQPPLWLNITFSLYSKVIISAPVRGSYYDLGAFFVIRLPFGTILGSGRSCLSGSAYPVSTTLPCRLPPGHGFYRHTHSIRKLFLIAGVQPFSFPADSLSDCLHLSSPLPYFPLAVHFCNPHKKSIVPVLYPFPWEKWDFSPIGTGHSVGIMGTVGRTLTIYLVPAEKQSGAT
jgi:hypothetical protein